jgi:hypothetical protein
MVHDRHSANYLKLCLAFVNEAAHQLLESDPTWDSVPLAARHDYLLNATRLLADAARQAASQRAALHSVPAAPPDRDPTPR